MNHISDKNAVSPFRAGLSCKCPKCGVGKLYEGFLDFREKCPNCGLDFSQFNSGDGPAVFITFILGFATVGLALFVEVTFHPPYWVHLVLWLPIILGGALLLMRPAKALMIAMQYHFEAEEGKLED